MRIVDNEPGGQTVILDPGDSLTGVPRSHRYLVTKPIQEVFRDPPGWLKRTEAACPFPRMAKWLRTLRQHKAWELQLHRGCATNKEFATAGFAWEPEAVRGALVSPPVGGDLRKYPEALRQYYSLVDAVHWNSFGCSGGLCDWEDHMPLAAMAFDYHGAEVDLRSSRVFGYTPCGDMFIYTSDGRGGWLSMGTHEIRLIGTIGDTIDWVYAELLAGRCPNPFRV